MNCPDTVGECIDRIMGDAQEMAPYYQALGEPDDGTSAYLEEELWSAPWHGPNPGLPYHKVPTGLSESPLTIREYLEWGFSAEGYYGTDVEYWHDRDLLIGLRSQIHELLTRHSGPMLNMPPYVKAAKLLSQLVGQRERHERALQEGYAYYSSRWILGNLSTPYGHRKPQEINLWRSAIHGISRRRGDTINDGRLHDGGDSMRQPCFVNSPTGAYVEPMIVFRRWQDKGPRDMRGWLFKFDPLTK